MTSKRTMKPIGLAGAGVKPCSLRLLETHNEIVLKIRAGSDPGSSVSSIPVPCLCQFPAFMEEAEGVGVGSPP